VAPLIYFYLGLKEKKKKWLQRELAARSGVLLAALLAVSNKSRDFEHAARRCDSWQAHKQLTHNVISENVSGPQKRLDFYQGLHLNSFVPHFCWRLFPLLSVLLLLPFGPEKQFPCPAKLAVMFCALRGVCGEFRELHFDKFSSSYLLFMVGKILFTQQLH